MAFPARRPRAGGGRRLRLRRRADLERGPPCGCCSRSPSRSARWRRPARWPTTTIRGRRASSPARLPPRSASSPPGPCSAACAAGSTPRRRRAARLRRGRGARRGRRVDPLPAPRDPRHRRPGVAAGRRPPARGREVRGSADPAVKKLVLSPVIDAMKPAMLERAVASGRAPTLELLLERGQHVDDCVAAFPSVTPVCAASIATGTGPDEHEIPAMNWYHRGEGRYVEYGTSFRASQAFGIKQSLTDTIYNMNLEHLSRGRADGVRAARRRRRAHRRHDVPDVPRPAPARGVGRHRADADRLARSSATPSTGRGSCSTRTCSPRGGRRAARSSACRACATSTPAASASTSSSTTCSTSCSSRCPTTTRTRTRTGRSRRSTRWPRPTASSRG